MEDKGASDDPFKLDVSIIEDTEHGSENEDSYFPSFIHQTSIDQHVKT